LQEHYETQNVPDTSRPIRMPDGATAYHNKVVRVVWFTVECEIGRKLHLVSTGICDSPEQAAERWNLRR
jgi:hypothetical protein